jgi:hypothetical protein
VRLLGLAFPFALAGAGRGFPAEAVELRSVEGGVELVVPPAQLNWKKAGAGPYAVPEFLASSQGKRTAASDVFEIGTHLLHWLKGESLPTEDFAWKLKARAEKLQGELLDLRPCRQLCEWCLAFACMSRPTIPQGIAALARHFETARRPAYEALVRVASEMEPPLLSEKLFCPEHKPPAGPDTALVVLELSGDPFSTCGPCEALTMVTRGCLGGVKAVRMMSANLRLNEQSVAFGSAYCVDENGELRRFPLEEVLGDITYFRPRAEPATEESARSWRTALDEALDGLGECEELVITVHDDGYVGGALEVSRRAHIAFLFRALARNAHKFQKVTVFLNLCHSGQTAELGLELLKLLRKGPEPHEGDDEEIATAFPEFWQKTDKLCNFDGVTAGQLLRLSTLEVRFVTTTVAEPSKAPDSMWTVLGQRCSPVSGRAALSIRLGTLNGRAFPRASVSPQSTRSLSDQLNWYLIGENYFRVVGDTAGMEASWFRDVLGEVDFPSLLPIPRAGGPWSTVGQQRGPANDFHDEHFERWTDKKAQSAENREARSGAQPERTRVEQALRPRNRPDGLHALKRLFDLCHKTFDEDWGEFDGWVRLRDRRDDWERWTRFITGFADSFIELRRSYLPYLIYDLTVGQTPLQLRKCGVQALTEEGLDGEVVWEGWPSLAAA